MFAVGDYVVYGYEGVCRVEEIGSPGVSGLDRNRQYYRLTPHYRGGTIYAPVDGRVRMRRVISREALDALLPTLPELPTLDDVPENTRLAGEYYRAILAEHSCERLLRLCKTFHEKQKRLAASHRSINSTELRSWKTAEEMLYGEFGFVLGIAPTEVQHFLQKNMA